MRAHNTYNATTLSRYLISTNVSRQASKYLSTQEGGGGRDRDRGGHKKEDLSLLTFAMDSFLSKSSGSFT